MGRESSLIWDLNTDPDPTVGYRIARERIPSWYLWASFYLLTSTAHVQWSVIGRRRLPPLTFFEAKENAGHRVERHRSVDGLRRRRCRRPSGRTVRRCRRRVLRPAPSSVESFVERLLMPLTMILGIKMADLCFHLIAWISKRIFSTNRDFRFFRRFHDSPRSA